MNVKKVYEDGAIFGAEVLDITPENIRERFQKAIANMASISLASGYITKPAIPHLIANAFKNLASVTFSTEGVSFKQADKLKEAAKNAVYVAAPTAAAGGAPAKAKEEEKPKEEEADVDMGGLFGDEY
jgi:large subunit ribosomal protein LP0